MFQNLRDLAWGILGSDVDTQTQEIVLAPPSVGLESSDSLTMVKVWQIDDLSLICLG